MNVHNLQKVTENWFARLEKLSNLFILKGK